jgi:hypothetical protein
MVRGNSIRLQKVLQDSIVVNIPISVTADMGIAIARTREKRIRNIYEMFPSLRKSATQKDETTNNSDGNEDEAKTKESTNKSEGSKRSNPLTPHRSQYGNIVDYLEAKYVRGVMIQDDEDADDEDMEDDEKRSVYDSESSFLDDSLLKRDVASQVLSKVTYTKLELEQDDESFFVNVGPLEIEENELTNYDPLDDEAMNATKPTKRKRPTSMEESKSIPPKKAKILNKNSPVPIDKEKTATEQTIPKPLTKKIVSNVNDEPSSIKSDSIIPSAIQDQINALKKRAVDLKEKSNDVFKRTCDLIKSLTEKDLPRRKKNEKVSIVVPEGKNPGDDITFANPHVPGQKLRVKVPKNATSGSKFVVSVPVPNAANPDVDNNKWSREAQDLLDEYSHTYDDWCHAEAAWREVDPSSTEKFQLHHERMNKFDQLLPFFPKDLITPIDGTYLRKVVRRARQNKHKRSKTAQKLEEEGILLPSNETSVPSTVKSDSVTMNTSCKINIPGKGKQFPLVEAPISM